ncbi:MAG: hypothetical protein KA200_03645 [Burkholderiales bacterium]|nr:hypothetical protein [Burkholderiales bacterium]
MSRDPDPHDGVATLDAAHAYAARGWSVIPFEARSAPPLGTYSDPGAGPSVAGARSDPATLA